MVVTHWAYQQDPERFSPAFKEYLDNAMPLTGAEQKGYRDRRIAQGYATACELIAEQLEASVCAEYGFGTQQQDQAPKEAAPPNLIQTAASEPHLSSQSPATRRSKHGEAANRVRKKLLSRLQGNRLPSTIRSAAREIGEHYSTVRREVAKSTVLSSHFKVKSGSSDPPGSENPDEVLEELLEQADANTKQYLDSLDARSLREVAEQISKLPAGERLALIQNIQTDPDSYGKLPRTESLEGSGEPDPTDLP
jgi:hypothetical protein